MLKSERTCFNNHAEGCNRLDLRKEGKRAAYTAMAGLYRNERILKVKSVIMGTKAHPSRARKHIYAYACRSQDFRWRAPTLWNLVVYRFIFLHEN